MGYFNVAGGANIRMMDTQAKALTAVVCGDVQLPDVDHMLTDRKMLRQRYSASARYGLELEPADHRRQIDALMGAGPQRP